MTILVRHLILIIAMICAFFFGRSQVNEQSELFRTLKQQDSILFDAAFNRCDTAVMESLFTTDFEFYHDKGGTKIGRDAFMEPIAVDCANRNPAEQQPAKRILIDNSLEVFPLYENGKLYGAIQHGIHRFEFLNAQKEYQRGDTAKFTHLWVLEDSQWKIKRELSYDHQFQQQNEIK